MEGTAALLWYLGVWWGIPICLFVDILVRWALPSAPGRLPGQGWAHPNPTGWIWTYFGLMLIIRQLINTQATDAVATWLWSNRQSFNIFVGLGLCLIGRALRDVKYFRNVPEADIRRFEEEPAPQTGLFEKRTPEDW
ncbi:MAG: hypothetical protein QM755_21895 [Luteolibacter sp.]